MQNAECGIRIGGLAALLTCLASPAAGLAAITIGAGPHIGTDSAGNSYNEEFQDWTHADCRALDGAGAAVGGRYNHNDGFDDSRDLIAFYSRDEGGNYYFRADFFDLALGAEVGNLDLYVAIDTGPGGQAFMPDFTDVKVDPSHHWEVCINLYQSDFQAVKDQNFNDINGVFVGAYFNSQLDSVEFGITRQALLDHGWDGSRTLYFTVMTVKDGSNGGAGEINGGAGSTSDATDTFFDDGRGFDDEVINGAIASNSNTGRAKYASIAHGNQSVNQSDDLRVHIFDPPTAQKTGFIRALDTHEIFNVPLNIHMSGSLIVAANWAKAGPGDDPLTDGPAFLQRVGEFVNADQGDGKPGSLIGGVFAEHIMPYFEGDVNQKSIAQFDILMFEIYGLTPQDIKVMHIPERVVRSQPTNLSPLDGFTFQDIEASHYTATYIDEVTHLHYWFYPGEAWSGFNGSFDAPHHHKIHKINDVYCFAINDREDQQKFGNHDGGMTRDVRFTLVDKADHPDQSQLTLIFDDWEAMAGKSFDPGAGMSAPNSNQIQYQMNIRWAANHQWIEIVNLNDILDRATNTNNPQYNAAWVIDQGFRFDLSIQNYEWLKHASEDSYNYWYYNEDSGFTGNEQDFYDLVPVLTGEQGDYHRRFPGNEPFDDAGANAKDAGAGATFLPSGKKHGDLNSPGTLMHDSWAAIAAAPAGRLKSLAEMAFSSLIFETAWHEEDDGSTGSYQGTNFGNPWPHPDTTWDGVNTWALRLQNHVRSTGITAAAAQWVESVRTAVQTPVTTVEALDLDFDGQDEYVLRNNRVYACFERWGGRCTHAFAFIHSLDDAVQVLGAPVVNPSEPGEEERIGPGANRASAFKDMDPSYVDADFSVNLLSDAIELTAPDGKIVKRITLGTGSGVLRADYTNTTGGTHYVRIGASPNVTDLVHHGQAHLVVNQSPSLYEIVNTQGGAVKVHIGTSMLNPAPADAGHLNRNLALTEQIEVSGGAAFSFDVELNAAFCGDWIRADFDEDCDVDADDFGMFQACHSGPSLARDPGCGREDFDGDNDVDASDFGKFQICITGPNVVGNPDCAN